MPSFLIIARLTLVEAARRRLLLAVAILTVIVVGLTGWGISRVSTLGPNGQTEPHSVVMTAVATFVILIAYMFNSVMAVGAAFLAAPAISADVESGLVLAILPRPLRRADFVLGKWLGLALLLSCYSFAASALELGVVDLLTGYLPPHPITAVAFLTGQSLVLLTLALLFSTRLAPMTGGIIALVLFGIAWLAGIVTQIGVAVGNGTVTMWGTVIGLILPTDGLWRGAIYNLEPAVLIAASSDFERANPFAANAPPSAAIIVWAVAWVIVVLALAVVRFARRDL